MKLRYDPTGIVGYLESEGLLREDPDELIKKLQEILSSRVEEAYIFGSYARSNQTKKSDLDLILVKNTDKKFHDRIEDFEDLYEQISPDLDILVYTPSEFKKSCAKVDNGFWRKVVSEMRQII